MKYKYTENRIRKILDELLRESFNKDNTLLKQLRGEILELEYKNDEVMIQDILDDLDSKVTALQIELGQKEARIFLLETEKISLRESIGLLEVENISLNERIEALEPTEEEPPI